MQQRHLWDRVCGRRPENNTYVWFKTQMKAKGPSHMLGLINEMGHGALSEYANGAEFSVHKAFWEFYSI